MNNIIKQEDIERKNYIIRGEEVMFDSNIAEIYKCANGTKQLIWLSKEIVIDFQMIFTFS